MLQSDIATKKIERNKYLQNAKLSKQEMSNGGFVQINAALIREITQTTYFEGIKVINFHTKTKGDSKIRKIEGLDQLVNLEELNLSYNLISRMENLERLTKLRDLNLAENNIKRIENLEGFGNLEKLNLNGNLIESIPESIRSLTQLNTLKLSRNRIEDPSGLVNLRALASLRILNISENPICKLPGHVDLCAYVCPALEYLDSKKITHEQKGTSGKLFNFEKLDLIAQDLDTKDSELKSLKEQNRMLQISKSELIEENRQLKNKIEKLEQDKVQNEEQLQRKTQEVQEKIKRISELEQELSHSRIEHLSRKFASNNWVSGQSTQPDDHEPALNKMSGNDSSLVKKMSELQVEKDELDKRIQETRELLQNFEKEYQNFPQKNQLDCDTEKVTSYNNSFQQGERLAALQAKSVRYREESLELHKRIEDIRDKIAKSTQMIQQLNSNEYGNAKDDRLLLENNLKRLHQRQKDFESEYSEVIEQLRKCNREIEVLNDENSNFEEKEYEDLLMLNTKTSVVPAHRLQSQEEQELSNLIQEAKSTLDELNSRYSQVDNELAEAALKFQEIKNSDSEPQRDSKLDVPKRYYSKSTQREETPQDTNQMTQKESDNIAEKLSPILTVLKKLLLTLKKSEILAFQAHETKLCSTEKIIPQMDAALKSSDINQFERVFVEMIHYFEKNEEINRQLLQKRIMDQELHEKKLSEQEERLQEIIRQEKEIRSRIEQRRNEFEQMNATVTNETNIHTNLYETTKTLYQKILAYRNQMKTLTQTDDFEKAFEASNEIEKASQTEEKTREMAFWIHKVLKYLDNTFERVQSFDVAKRNFLEEFEKETKELAVKWKELEQRKSEFRNKIQEEKEDFKRQMEAEYNKFEEERSVWRTEKEKISQYKRGLEEEIHRLIEDREVIGDSLKRDQEKKDVIRKNFETQVQSFEKELKSLRAEIEKEESLRQKLKAEHTEIQRLSELEFRRHADIKEDLAKLLHTKQEVETEVEEQTKKLERTRRDRQVLQEEITGLKKRMDEAGDEYKEILQQLKTQEKSLKKTLEALDSEIDFKRKNCNEIEIRAQEINDKLTLKEQSITELEFHLQEIQKERELHWKQKQDALRLSKELEEQNLTLEENKMKIEMKEGQLQSLKKQSEGLMSHLKEKQLELQQLDKKIHQTIEKGQDAQFKLDRIEQTLNVKQEEVVQTETEINEKMKEIERLNLKLSELNELGRSKEQILEELDREIANKAADVQEFDEIIEENDEKYKKVIKENRETLEQILKDLKQKEDEYHNLLVDIDKLAQQRSEMSVNYENIEQETILKEDQLKRIAENFAIAEAELSRIHQSILILTDQETQLETKLEVMKTQEKKLVDASNELSQKILDYREQAEELRLKIQELQAKEDSVYVLMALNGEQVTHEMEKKIKKMVESHSQVLELEKTNGMIEGENKILKDEINHLRRRLNSFIKTGQDLPQSNPLPYENALIQGKQLQGDPVVFFNTAHEIRLPQTDHSLQASIKHNRRASYSELFDYSQVNGSDALEGPISNNVLGPLNINTEFFKRKLEDEYDSSNTRRSTKGRIVSNPISHQSPYASAQGIRDPKMRRISENKENIQEPKAGHMTPNVADKNKNPDSKFQSLMSQLKEAHNQIVSLSRKEEGTEATNSFENTSLKKIEDFSNTFHQAANQFSPINRSSAQEAVTESVNVEADQNLMCSAKFTNLNPQGFDAETAQETLQNNESTNLEDFGLIFENVEVNSGPSLQKQNITESTHRIIPN